MVRPNGNRLLLNADQSSQRTLVEIGDLVLGVGSERFELPVSFGFVICVTMESVRDKAGTGYVKYLSDMDLIGEVVANFLLRMSYGSLGACQCTAK